MKISATIQARIGSGRLPGKVLLPIMGRPMLELQIERIRQSLLVDEIIIATSTAPANDLIEALASRLGVHCFRGSEDDVLGRVAGALRAHDVELHVELMGDSPMPDPSIIDAVIGFYLKNRDRYDYVSNALKTTYPPGANVYVYPAAVLLDAESQTASGPLREYVGIHIYQHPERYRIFNITAPPWLHCPDLHLEVDTPVDYDVVKSVYEHLYPRNPAFSLHEAIEFAMSSGLAAKNRDVERRWRAFRLDAP